MKIIFLDIDGVLNRHTWNDEAKSCFMEPECIKNFNKILNETNAKVVLSSAWRYLLLWEEGPETMSIDNGPAMTIKGFEYLMRTHGVSFKFNLIGYTRSDEEFGWSPQNNIHIRGKQIYDWLDCFLRNNNENVDYIIIDDNDFDIPSRFPANRFIKTNPHIGLTESNANRAIEILNGTSN